MTNHAKIKVFGVGGAGCNAVNRMVDANVGGAEFYVCNTDLQVLEVSNCVNKIALGPDIIKGLGAGGDPEVGKEAAKASEEEIAAAIEGADMVFITAGLGGGTGTGAAPLFAKIAKSKGALTVAVVTKPFSMEGNRRGNNANEGLKELEQHVDSIIIISNEKVKDVIGNIPIVDSFREVDNILRQAVQTITDLIETPALINLDFNDVKSVMKDQGRALIGIGMAKKTGDNNAASEAAALSIQSPLLDSKIAGAQNAIINISGGNSLCLEDCEDAINVIRQATGNNLEIIQGFYINDALGDEIIVSIIATGFDKEIKENPITFDNQINNNRSNNLNRPKTVQVKEINDEQKVPGFFKNR